MIKNTIKIDNSLTLYYEESGHGDNVILFIPGWTMSTRVFEKQLEFFENSGRYRVITFDPRAQGLSSKTEDGHFYEQHGQDLDNFIKKMELEKFTLCGWSFGTLTCLAYLNQFGTDRLSGLIMLDGPPRATGYDSQSEWVSYQYDDRDARQQFYTLGKLKNPQKTNRAFAEWMLEDKTQASIQWIMDITNQTPNNVAALLNASSIFLDYSADLMSLDGKIPLCYIVRASQKGLVTRWRDLNTPSAEVYAFGEHLMFWERDEEFNQLLLTNLQKS